MAPMHFWQTQIHTHLVEQVLLRYQALLGTDEATENAFCRKCFGLNSFKNIKLHDETELSTDLDYNKDKVILKVVIPQG